MTRPEDQKLFTLGRRCGQLGNRLVIFANLIALAEEQGHRVINFTFHSYSDLFENTRENLYCEYPAPKRKHWLDKIPGIGAAIRKTRIFYHVTRYACLLNERLPIFGRAVTLRQLRDRRITPLDGPEVREIIRPARLVFVYGWWFRTPDLVKKHGDKIREYFRPIEKYEIASRETVDQLRRDADVVIGVHVRHRDNRTWRGGKFFFPTERYVAWMRELIPQFPGRKVSFLVCSDEPRSVDEFPGLTIGFGSKSAATDLYSFARCDYILGTKSTFTQWASFYGEKPLLQVVDSNEVVKLENFRVCYLDWD